MEYLQIIQKLSENGYTNLKQITNKRIVVTVDSDRMGALLDIADKLGGKYVAKSSYSSLGMVTLNNGYVFVVKNQSGGSGAGAEVTALVESLHCYFAAAAFYGNEKFDMKTLKDTSNYVDADRDLNKIMKTLGDDWIASARQIVLKLKNVLPNKRYKFHRGSKWVQRIENHFKKLNRIESNFSNVNKWSPADIYILTSVGENLNIESTKSIHELNSLLLTAYNSNDVIGVSLKKWVSGNVKYEPKNISKKRKEYVFESFTTGKRGPFQSKDIFLYYSSGDDSGNIQLRTFGNPWQGEIKGKYANHGKIGGGVIHDIFRRIVGVRMIDKKKLEKKTKENIEHFWNFFQSVEGNIMNKENFIENIMKKDSSWFVSKILGYQLLFYLNKMTKAEKTSIITAFISYAASESDLSAPFVKVH